MAEIKFVRKYIFYGNTVYDIIYQSRRSRLGVMEKDLPKTVKQFITGKIPTVQNDKFNGREEIYK